MPTRPERRRAKPRSSRCRRRRTRRGRGDDRDRRGRRLSFGGAEGRHSGRHRHHIYQEARPVDDLSVAGNIYLGQEPHTPLVPTGRMREAGGRDPASPRAQDIPRPARVGKLSTAGKQVVSMAPRAAVDPRLIIMTSRRASSPTDEVANLSGSPRADRPGRRSPLHLATGLEEIARGSETDVKVIKDDGSSRQHELDSAQQTHPTRKTTG